jgi:putative DNA primase/helicase
MDPIDAFLDAVQAIYGPVAFTPLADGTIQRFHVHDDKPGSRNGWCVPHLDGIASGCFGSWKSGGIHHWSSRQPTNPLEAEQVRQRSEQAKRERKTEQIKRYQVTTEKAQRLWRDASPAAPSHPYLVAKSCRPHGLRQLGHALLVPLYREGQLVNLQRIFPDGAKRFLQGGRVSGCYSPLGTIKPGQPLTVCEGWATGATLHEDTGGAVACALSAGNLLAVGRHLRERYPDTALIIAGDDDRETKGNPGRTAATEAAAVLGCELMFPLWPANAPQHLSDVNDLQQWVRHHE